MKASDADEFVPRICDIMPLYMRDNAQRDGRPLGESKLWSYFSSSVDQSSPQ